MISGACCQVEGRAVSESEDEDDGAAAEAAAQAAAVATAQADGANVVLESASRPSAGTDRGVMQIDGTLGFFCSAGRRANVVLESASRPSVGTDPGVIRVEWDPRGFWQRRPTALTFCWRAASRPSAGTDPGVRG